MELIIFHGAVPHVLLEGGRAIPRSMPIQQDDVPELVGLVKRSLALPRCSLVGSAGKKPRDQPSGDVDLAVECSWAEAIKLASRALQARPYRGIGIISIGVIFKGTLRQVDLIPTESLDLCSWSYWSDKEELAAGLKGSHRNELLFSCAKHVLSTPGARYILNLSSGLYLLDKSGRELVSTDPVEICKLLTGQSSKLMTLGDAVDAVASTYPNPAMLKRVVTSTFDGLTSKSLTTDHPALVKLASLA